MPYTEIRIKKSEIKFFTVKNGTLRLILPQPTLCKKDGMRGVYVWGFYNNKKFYPLYVGKAANLFNRLINHYCYLRGGSYRMFDLKNVGRRTPIYEPKCFNDVIKYPDSKIGLPKILNSFAFRYVETEDTVVGEKYVTEKILKGLCGSLYPKVSLKKLLISGCRANIDQFPVTHNQSKDLDDMVTDIIS